MLWMVHPGAKANPWEPVVSMNPEFMASSFVTLGESEENLSEPGFLLEANYTLLMELL